MAFLKLWLEISLAKISWYHKEYQFQTVIIYNSKKVPLLLTLEKIPTIIYALCKTNLVASHWWHPKCWHRTRAHWRHAHSTHRRWRTTHARHRRSGQSKRKQLGIHVLHNGMQLVMPTISQLEWLVTDTNEGSAVLLYLLGNKIFLLLLFGSFLILWLNFVLD